MICFIPLLIWWMVRSKVNRLCSFDTISINHYARLHQMNSAPPTWHTQEFQFYAGNDIEHDLNVNLIIARFECYTNFSGLKWFSLLYWISCWQVSLVVQTHFTVILIEPVIGAMATVILPLIMTVFHTVLLTYKCQLLLDLKFQSSLIKGGGRIIWISPLQSNSVKKIIFQIVGSCSQDTVFQEKLFLLMSNKRLYYSLFKTWKTCM